MRIETNTNSSFPSQVVSDEEKASLDYGIQVGRAIEGEWFQEGRSGNRYAKAYSNFHQLRLYARGEQSIAKYKDEMSINGDLSYLNLDWTPVAIVPKFVDIVVNGMSEKNYDINAVAQDPYSLKQRGDYQKAILRDINNKEALENFLKIGMNLYKTSNPEDLPASKEELDLYMQMNYKQQVEIAEEELINNVLSKNKYDQTKKRIAYDLAVLGIGASKTMFNKAEGITIDYVDPAYMVYSYTEDPNFEDVYYIGEVKSITIPELKKQYPNIPEEELLRIQQMPGNSQYITGWGNYDENTVQVMYFEYKTSIVLVTTSKLSFSGGLKVSGFTKAFSRPWSVFFILNTWLWYVLYSKYITCTVFSS